ncbi:hypothetical protein IE81DRAFT_336978 [Ceraceosorus guamensis]|uniref:Uncharacterized protein n=1 Tax=Ceraceosorus guamensis TaxID=1522189 RepID=A0A316W7J0_9BASI|nr:hypothetical protein IE81DRAFT_336978 [Ceraceosorus guamensis]PWN43615.1 hypothetical protein IE81DRAFT_336978 [Ceraceosorus guamensis]
MALSAHELPKALEPKYESLKKEFSEVDAELQRQANKLSKPLYEKRDAIIAEIEKFWPNALQNCPHISSYFHDEDEAVFEHLTGISVTQSDKDPRESSVTFKFADNDFFGNKELTKKFTVKKDAPPLGSSSGAWQEDVQTEATKIDWKSDDKNLSKKYPLVNEQQVLETGSFFACFFEAPQNPVPIAIGDGIINVFWPNAFSFYTGDVEDIIDLDDMEDFDDEDEDDEDEDEDDDDKEIDLEAEERSRKKPKHEA